MTKAAAVLPLIEAGIQTICLRFLDSRWRGNERFSDACLRCGVSEEEGPAWRGAGPL